MPLTSLKPAFTPETAPWDFSELGPILGLSHTSPDQFLNRLPFSPRDVTAGAEHEFQTAVKGPNAHLDLVQTIKSSNYYRNLIRRARSGDFSQQQVGELERFLTQGEGRAWSNSWVRFPEQALGTYARHIFRSDLKSNKADPTSPDREDHHRFHISHQGENFIRVPVSYLLKLALADFIGSQTHLHPLIRITGERMMTCFLNDNSSPEILSFHPVRSGSGTGIGRDLALETLIRYLFSQLLLLYAQDKFQLSALGQEVKLFFSATPPQIQEELNRLISDSFYRELFMSPCLSGWSRGEVKQDYMKRCHKVLSRSKLNTLSKLREAGIITSNLVVMPSTSSTSLSNNGTHISLGSKKLSALLKDPASGFTPDHEKQLGDLVIKIAEHFIGLFPGTYSASPTRLGFHDFHPEKVLGFLPHELDFTHLRMIWRRWKGKADLNILGRPVTPFGPLWLDSLLSRLFRLKGDFVPDYRPIDYLVALMGAHQSPGLDGTPGNSRRLLADLAQMGVFDTRMSLYQPIKIRKYQTMGFSGFEHRYYSIFENINSDMGGAADLQTLITALAVQWALKGEVTHGDIPDTPDVESERRQIFFAASIDLPTFYVKTRTKNQLLLTLVKGVKSTRSSRRYPGYTRVKTREYKAALLRCLQTEGAALTEAFRMGGMLSDLEIRLKSPRVFSASGRLVQGILKDEKNPRPMDHSSTHFNGRAEDYYMESLRRKQMKEAYKMLHAAFQRLDLWAGYRDAVFKQALESILGQGSPQAFLKETEQAFLDQELTPTQLTRLMNLIILHVNKETKNFEKRQHHSPSIH
ncbi:MAG: hypothetical protein MI747_08535 [Desulfobacterales bacterium]|nr:hypothetical protein [Desulfobacterales bacterium]